MTAQSGDMPANDFSLWFALKAAAADSNWDLVTEHIANTGTQAIVRHPLTIPVMQAAVTTGRAEVVATLIARGYLPEREDVKAVIDVLEFTVLEDMPRVSEALGKLCAPVDAVELRTVIAAAWHLPEAATVIPQLTAAGLDVLLGGDVIDIVVEKQKPELMQLMLEQGASPFAPKTVAAIVARGVGGGDIKRAWWMAACAHSDHKRALVRFEGMCLAGGDWHAGAFLNPLGYDRGGAPVTLLGILAAQNKLGEVFQAAHWQNTPAEAVAVHEALAAYGLKDSVSLAPLVAAINRHNLATRKSGGSRFKL